MIVPKGEWTPLLDLHRPPDLFCPFETRINPCVEAAEEEALDWALALGLVDGGRGLSKLERARLTHLEARAFPDAPPEALALLGKWVTLFCAIDDYVEASRLGPLRLSAYLSDALAAFSGESTAGQGIIRACHDVGRMLTEFAGPEVKAAFARELDVLFSAFVWEEINREHMAYPDYPGYRVLRTTTVGLRPHFLIARRLGPAYPDSAEDALLLSELERMACLIVGWCNDIFTYEKELAQGECHNLVAVLMRTQGVPLSTAYDRAAALHDQEVCSFLTLQARLERSARASEAVTYRIAHLCHWIGGHMHWASQNERYRPAA